MAENSNIEWTNHTFNSHMGCTKVSQGCDNCYAEKMGNRFGIEWGPGATRKTMSDNYWKQPIKWNKRAGENGKRERVFCASMADVFDKEAPEGVRDRLWSLIKATPNLDWIIVTKRIGNAKEMLPIDWHGGYTNVWLLITIVNQMEADRDIPKLLNTPAAIRGLSMEPLLEEVCLKAFLPFSAVDEMIIQRNPHKTFGGINWVIVGGESQNHARPMHPAWALTLRNQCKIAGVPFFFKQWGEWKSFGYTSSSKLPRNKAHCEWWPLDNKWIFGSASGLNLAMVKTGKEEAGRLLDGKIYNEIPTSL